jgi:hypothetical protein
MGEVRPGLKVALVEASCHTEHVYRGPLRKVGVFVDVIQGEKYDFEFHAFSEIGYKVQDGWRYFVVFTSQLGILNETHIQELVLAPDCLDDASDVDPQVFHRKGIDLVVAKWGLPDHIEEGCKYLERDYGAPFTTVLVYEKKNCRIFITGGGAVLAVEPIEQAEEN